MLHANIARANAVLILTASCMIADTSAEGCPPVVCPADRDEVLALVEQNERFAQRIESLEAQLATLAAPVNCTPQDKYLFDLSSSNWEKDLFQCLFDAPSSGFLYLSLQAHQRSRDQGACSFGIYVDGEQINTASRNYPSHTYLSGWHPGFMADTVSVSRGSHVISLRAQGKACSIHDPDINGFFISGRQ